jgi:hypothetical protein
MRSFMELLLGWIVRTQHLLSDPWIGTGQMNISGTGLKGNLCLPMRGTGSQLQDGVIQKAIWRLVAAMGPVTVSSTQHYQIVYHNITACISPPYLLLTGHVMIAKCSNRTLYPYYDITCEHCILTNCINNSRPLDQKRILIVKQLAFAVLPVEINGTWYNNPGVQALLEVEKALTRHKRVIGLIIAGVLALVSLIASAVASTVALSQSIQTAHMLIIWLKM